MRFNCILLIDFLALYHVEIEERCLRVWEEDVIDFSFLFEFAFHY